MTASKKNLVLTFSILIW